MSIMHIACAADEKYLPHCCAMLHSVISKNRQEKIVVHFTYFPDFPQNKLNTLSAFISANGAELDVICVRPETLAGLPSTAALPSVVWQRVLLPELLPNLTKILYLDSDLIVLGSLKPLWDLDISSDYVAAVTNPMHEQMAGWPKKIGLPSSADYFNSGVMLMNLAKMREHGSVEKIFRHAHDHPELIHWGDQCAMSLIFHEHRYPLHPKWNMMNNFMTHRLGGKVFSDATIKEALDDPQIVHFEGAHQGKPWHYLSTHPYRTAYLQHRQQTPWPLTSLEERNTFNFVKKHVVPRSLLNLLRQLRQRARHHKNPVAP